MFAQVHVMTFDPADVWKYVLYAFYFLRILITMNEYSDKKRIRQNYETFFTVLKTQSRWKPNWEGQLSSFRNALENANMSYKYIWRL